MWTTNSCFPKYLHFPPNSGPPCLLLTLNLFSFPHVFPPLYSPSIGLAEGSDHVSLSTSKRSVAPKRQIRLLMDSSTKRSPFHAVLLLLRPTPPNQLTLLPGTRKVVPLFTTYHPRLILPFCHQCARYGQEPSLNLNYSPTKRGT